MKQLFARLKKEDKDIISFLEKQSNKDFSIKFLLRYGISKLGNKDLISFKNEIGNKGLEEVLKKV